MARPGARGDRIAGAALFGLGAAMVVVARGFPSIPAMAYGPDLFPTIVGIGLMASGLGVAAETAPRDDAATGGAAPDAGRSGGAARMLGLAGIVAAFALTLDPLGFHLAGTAAAFAAIRLYGGGWTAAAVAAPLGAVLLHALFYSAMRVPLPWGLLLPVAW